MIILFFNHAKIHVCETEAIADAVIADIKNRVGPEKAEFYRVDHPGQCIDFGGCIVQGVQPIEIPKTPFSFLAQHYSLLRLSLGDAIAKGNRGIYIKLHAERAHCMTPQTFEKVKTFLIDNESELLQRQADSSEDLLTRIAGLKQNRK